MFMHSLSTHFISKNIQQSLCVTYSYVGFLNVHFLKLTVIFNYSYKICNRCSKYAGRGAVTST